MLKNLFSNFPLNPSFMFRCFARLNVEQKWNQKKAKKKFFNEKISWWCSFHDGTHIFYRNITNKYCLLTFLPPPVWYLVTFLQTAPPPCPVITTLCSAELGGMFASVLLIKYIIYLFSWKLEFYRQIIRKRLIYQMFLFRVFRKILFLSQVFRKCKQVGIHCPRVSRMIWISFKSVFPKVRSADHFWSKRFPNLVRKKKYIINFWYDNILFAKILCEILIICLGVIQKIRVQKGGRWGYWKMTQNVTGGRGGLRV